MFKVQLDAQPTKFLRKADRILLKRLGKKIDSLKKDPVPHDAKRILNRKELVFRVRVGEYRIIYVVYHKENNVFIFKIEKRSRAYS